MNSVTPIASLTETVLMLLEDDDNNQKNIDNISQEDIIDMRECVKTILERSNSLFNFVEDYREVTKLPKPQRKNIKIEDLLKLVKTTMHKDVKKEGVEFNIINKANDFEINIDLGLIEQVLINLINNSLYFVKQCKNPKIIISAEQDNNNICLNVIDNGSGIEPKNIDEIFVPFFSTRENGSGIGLSLSKEIIRLHGGDITVSSIPFKETKFSIQL